MTTVAVIQARSGSTRFPNKVLADLQGRPMLAHVIERVSRAATVDRVVVATTVDPADDEVAALSAGCGANVSRGPVDDVLTRYLAAAHEHAADVVVRITADCPLTDPVLIDAVVHARAEGDGEYATNAEPPTYPDGYDVEALTSACLERLDREAQLWYEREHVTARARERPGEFRTVRVTSDRDLSWMRLTVDVPEDLARIAAVLDALPSHPPPGLAAVTALVETDPRFRNQVDRPGRDERYRAQRDAARAKESNE
ncbi:MAG: cytidylyltransferase domain-containing protein [Candidatus Dormibacteria bacterium]